MTYLTNNDMRLATLAEFAYGLDLSITEAPDAVLTAAITSQSLRIDDLTNDHFESETLTFELNVESYSSRLYLPKRCRAITSVTTRDEDGVLTTEPVISYRLSSSLNTAGDYRLSDVDFIDIVSTGITGSLFYWPPGTRTVQVAGVFSWLVTPTDIKRAVARLVYDELKERRPDVDRAETITNAGVTLRFLESDENHPTGIREVDQVIQRFYRWSKLAVG